MLAGVAAGKDQGGHEGGQQRKGPSRFGAPGPAQLGLPLSCRADRTGLVVVEPRRVLLGARPQYQTTLPVVLSWKEGLGRCRRLPHSW